MDCIDIDSESGYQTIYMIFPKNLLVSGNFKTGISLFIPNVEVLDVMSDFLFFEVTDT